MRPSAPFGEQRVRIVIRGASPERGISDPIAGDRDADAADHHRPLVAGSIGVELGTGVGKLTHAVPWDPAGILVVPTNGESLSVGVEPLARRRMRSIHASLPSPFRRSLWVSSSNPDMTHGGACYAPLR